jgi:hypothetical protein
MWYGCSSFLLGSWRRCKLAGGDECGLFRPLMRIERNSGRETGAVTVPARMAARHRSLPNLARKLAAAGWGVAGGSGRAGISEGEE